MHRLLKAGFKLAGSWGWLNDEEKIIRANFTECHNPPMKLLYAFVGEQRVVYYVGITTIGLRRRLKHYSDITKSSGETNKRCNKKIKTELKKNKTIRIYTCPVPGNKKIGIFDVDYGPSLEQSIIKKLKSEDKAEWNLKQ
ncbi:MAG: GIY-YIG nuclease family protein [Candidatus Omnitrophica bacterium]|nr:GIY-YIG nuclease family protein [Candidatus Omnitrophota bacterium]